MTHDPIPAPAQETQTDEIAEVAEKTAAASLAALADHVSDLRDHMLDYADAARGWAARQAESAKQTASERPALAVSASAGAALAVGLALGFILGRVTADGDY